MKNYTIQKNLYNANGNLYKANGKLYNTNEFHTMQLESIIQMENYSIQMKFI